MAGVLVAAIGLGAFLLFEIQFVVAKWLLPVFGGAASVWTTCMLFFQTALLLGYAYAHRLSSRAPRRQAAIHLGLLGLTLGALLAAALAWPSPVTPPRDLVLAPHTPPAVRLILLLALATGLPYFVLATTGPLLQAWSARLRPGASPYPLYALSNAGSLLGVALYPFAIEPLASLPVQGCAFAVLFALYAACVAVVAFAQRRAPALASGSGAREAQPRETVLLWWALPVTTSFALLAVTNQLTLDVAPIPFLWMLPLLLYLATFIWAFSAPGRFGGAFWGFAAAAASVAVGALYWRGVDVPLRFQAPAWLAFLFVLCAFAHGRLAALRPAPRELTTYYLTISAGGALGAFVPAIVAPILFRGIWELPIALYAGLLLPALLAARRGTLESRPAVRRVFVVGCAAVLVAAPLALALRERQCAAAQLAATRNFYGFLRVLRTPVWMTPPATARELLHGETVHGTQIDGPLSRVPTTYYGPRSGVGRVLEARRATRRLRVGVVGLGTGTLAAWGVRGDVYRFYELNPAVVELSCPPDFFFTYLRDSYARVEIAKGDARLVLEAEPAQAFDVFVLDAFSSDAIPVHLLTREAFGTWARHLRGPESVLAVHVSNRNFRLPPIVRGAAAAHGFWSVEFTDMGELAGTSPSIWVLLARDPAALSIPAFPKPLPPGAGAPPTWTDASSDLFRLALMKR